MSTVIEDSKLLLANQAKKQLNVLTITLNGESVNNLPKSFIGAVKLPSEGMDGENYDFAKVVDNGETYSKLTCDIAGSFTKNGKAESIISNAATLWGGAIKMVQSNGTIITDGTSVYAMFFATK